MKRLLSVFLVTLRLHHLQLFRSHGQSELQGTSKARSLDEPTSISPWSRPTRCCTTRTGADPDHEREAGIGKTRLADAFVEWVKGQGADVLAGRAFETGSGLAYQPLVEAIRRRIERENAPDDLLSDIWLIELSRLLPELRERYPDLPASGGDDTTAGIRLFEALVRLGQALDRIIITVACSTHTHGDQCVSKQGLIGITRVLRSSVRMEEESSFWTPMKQSHPPSHRNQRLILGGRHRLS